MVIQFAILFVAYMVIRNIGRERIRPNLLDYFLASVIPVVFLLIIVNVNETFFASYRKYDSQITTLYNFICIIPLGIGFLLLRKLHHSIYEEAWYVRVLGLSVIFTIQVILYFIIPEYGLY